MENQNINSKKDKKISIVDIVLLIIIIILLIALIITRFNKSDKSEIEHSSGGVQMGVIGIPESEEEIRARLNEVVEKGMFQVFINTGININKNNVADVMIQNSITNHYACYVEIIQDGKVIYKSDILEPGYKIENDEISQFNESGSSKCAAQFHVINTETNSEINTIGVEINITKEN